MGGHSIGQPGGGVWARATPVQVREKSGDPRGLGRTGRTGAHAKDQVRPGCPLVGGIPGDENREGPFAEPGFSLVPVSP